MTTEREREQTRLRARRFRLKKHGISLGEYEAMVTAQGNRCFVCKSDDSGPKDWVVDTKRHALLCYRCKSALTLMQEDTEVLRALANFIEGTS